VEAVRSGRYDLVLMDLRMPRLSGAPAARAIRRLEGDARRTPIIALTADATSERLREAIDAGMDGHVTKPFERKALLAMVDRYAG
jgi:CheY-like chemotaxis protein